ncbi:MAG: hypothetical protein NC177_10695 [Ruminococcus flavefaciens]|nr:hypothetical protein [Ruminococcus flavefaciens]
MDEPTVLRTTKIGGGFVKEDVMQYLDELNTKIDDLVKENEALKKAGPSSSSEDEIRKYKNQVENLQEKLNNSNNLLRAKNKELETAKETIAKLQAGKPLPAGSAPALAVNSAELENAKKEIENLKNQLKIAQTASAAQPANNNDSAELAKVKQDLARMSNELAVKAKAVDEKTRESASKDAKIAQLIKENAGAIAKKDAEISRINEELAKKDKEISELNNKAMASTPSGILAQAQMLADTIKNSAQEEVDKIKDSAKAEADKLVSDAKAEAEKTISSANATAESCINDANSKAKVTIDEANKHADTVNKMSADIRKSLINEIESLSAKFGEISKRFDEAKETVGDARKFIDTNASQDIKKMEAPKVNMSDVKANAEKVKTPAPEAPKKTTAINAVKPDNSAKTANNIKPTAPQPKKSVVNMDGMDDILKSFDVKPQAEAPAPAPKPAQPKPQAKKPVMNFGNDMADILAAIEADPNNIGE